MRETRDDPLAKVATIATLASLVNAGLSPPLPRPADAAEAAAAGDAHDAHGAADALGDAYAPLLHAVAPARTDWSDRPDARHARDTSAALRRRLLARVGASAASARTLHTLRHADTVAALVAPGVAQRTLYRATVGRARRPGEPDAVTLVELAPGAAWAATPSQAGLQAMTGSTPSLQLECLVLQGRLFAAGTPLQALDHHVVPAGADGGRWTSDTGALFYLRESQPAADAPARPTTQRAATAEWTAYAPGIRRRLMWRQGAQAAMLYHALPGAAVPHHGHRHDEECLMLAGDFFLDELLLRPLDYQIAPAGTEHRVSCTDTGVLIYAHGDVDLDLQ